jgi:outer membrane protein OmpA-like peptidoglycan-associated protein
MARRSRHTDYNEDLNIWPAFTDLMSNAFMILILFLLIAIVTSSISQKRIQETINNLDKNQGQAVKLALEVTELKQQVASLQELLKSQNTSTDAPPIIVIKDNDVYRFASGSAEISPKMSNEILKKIVPEIENRTKQYNINVVEIIGHTDSQPNGNLASNLDLNLEKVANGDLPIGNLKAGSNADLGLMRALAVVKVLRDMQIQQSRLQGLTFRAYSAAQLILPKDANTANQEDVTRRRIEIRFTRLGEVLEIK